MKRISGVLLVLALLFGCAPKAAPAFDIVVLYTNDVHASVDGGIGYAGLAAYKKALEKDGCEVILADAGDAVQGAPIATVSKGTSVIDIMNHVGYGVAIPGNHEFDYGLEQFMGLRDSASFPYISANFMDLRTGGQALDAYTTFDVHGVKIAFVGVTTPETITATTPASFMDENGSFIYGFCQDKTGETLYAAVQAAVDAARADGADYVIVLSHLGIDAVNGPYTSVELIGRTSGIDAVIDGHSHSTVACERVKNADGAGVVLSQTGSKFAAFGVLRIDAAGHISTTLITDYSEKDAGTDAAIKEIQSGFEEEMRKVVAHSVTELYAADPGHPDIPLVRSAETNLGDLCADACRAVGGADIAFVNGGGIRATLPKGELTYGDIIDVHSFGNTLCVIEVTGQQVLDALEYSVHAFPEGSGGFLQVSGLAFSFDPTVSSPIVKDADGMFQGVEGERRVKTVTVGNEAIDPAKTYTLAGQSFILRGRGNGYTMFAGCRAVLDNGMLDREALIRFIAGLPGGTVGDAYADPYGDGRITVVS